MRISSWKRVVAFALVAGGGASLAGACGARTGLDKKGPGPIPECIVDADCDGFNNKCRNVKCMLVPANFAGAGGGASSSSGSTSSSSEATSSASTTGASGGAGGASDGLVAKCVEGKPVDCDDANPCTLDSCDVDTGACSYVSAVHDLDGDGYPGPREGTKVGDPDACGTDCDDTNPNAHPNFGSEPCDGVDNDCNGIVDDNMTFVPYEGEQPKQVSDHPSGDAGGIAYNGTNYAALFTEDRPPPDSTDMLNAMLTGLGDKVPPGQQRVTAVNADSYAGTLLWVGDRFGVVWEDRRDSDYEIYFTELDDKGNKIQPDQRLTHADGFSIYPDLAFTGNHFVTVWQDERDGEFNVYGQVLDVDGNVVGGNKRLTPKGDTMVPSEAPAIAATSQSIGITWTRDDTFIHFVMFQRFDFDLNPIGDPIQLTDGTTEAVYPVIAFNKDRYIIAWADHTLNPAGIYASVVGLDGTIIKPPTLVSGTPPGAHSRYPTIRALGDRTLIVYADDRDQNQGYELYSRVFDNDLNGISPEFRVTNSPFDSIKPKMTFGPQGDVGILYRDDKLGQQLVWFTRLQCKTTIMP